MSRRLRLEPCVEGVLVVPLEGRILVLLAEEAVADDQHVDLGTHEAAEGVFGGADDRLAPDVEAGVHDHGTAGLRLEGADQRVIARIGVGMDGLDARRIIDMGDGWDVGARDVQLFDAEQGLFRLGHGPAPFPDDVGDHQHIGAVFVDLEPVRDILAQH
jgi:hypothetical protein